MPVALMPFQPAQVSFGQARTLPSPLQVEASQQPLNLQTTTVVIARATPTKEKSISLILDPPK